MQLAHAAALVAPTVVEYVPALHDRHTDALVAASVDEYVPVLQYRHNVSTEAPADVEYVPALQFTTQGFGAEHALGGIKHICEAAAFSKLPEYDKSPSCSTY